ncbi:MAG TPA: SpoIID/LytB domain-containing protein [Clostridiales bacterium]|nr:SpoIID/LytB domain-containing protein [Clostridiales bacterium]
MSIKKKLILIGVCIVIVIAIFTINVVRQIKSTSEDNDRQELVQENIISKGEAYRLLSYLKYNKNNREALPFEINYQDENMSGWYDSYVNAAWNMGLIEKNIRTSPKEALTYGECKVIIDKLIIEEPWLQTVYEELSYDFINAVEVMKLSEFLELYEAILTKVPEEKRLVKDETLFVLGRDETNKDVMRMVTDQGRYYYNHTMTYEKPYELLKTSSFDNKDMVELYMDKGIDVKICGNEIVYITAITTDKIVLKNVWVVEGKGNEVNAFINGIDKKFEGQFPLSKEVNKVIADISIENQKIVQISVKPDIVHGKVLQSGEDYIEIDGYGKIPLEEDYRIYKVYGNLSSETTNSILVGYENTDFVVSGGKISAALITESIKAANIRVLLKTSGFASNYHEEIILTSDEEFVISSKERDNKYTAGEKVTISIGDELLKDGRIKVYTSSGEGKIQLLSVKRSEGNPKYRGTLEIVDNSEGLLLVNELPLEEYLYAVIPSEMPTYYGIEALKVQAVCARSYAYRHLMANSLNKYGAHVDDSVSYQVYNNISENEDSVLAVKDTYGQVIEYDGEVITAYYFSTSCGHTTTAEYVWANGEPIPYLKGRLMAVEDSSRVLSQENIRDYRDLSNEETFRKFISEDTLTTYDSEFNWYRWTTKIDIDTLNDTIDEKLASRYRANSNLILTMVNPNEGGTEPVYESIPVDSIGEIVDISVKNRETGGIITDLLITGSKKTILVKTEYNIRSILAPLTNTLIRKDLSEVNNLKLLPSAFFVIDKTVDDGKLRSITLNGGGYGHGVGMSQNGVKAMIDNGIKYKEILSYFYDGTEIGFIYE